MPNLQDQLSQIVTTLIRMGQIPPVAFVPVTVSAGDAPGLLPINGTVSGATLTAPILSGTVSGTYTLGGTPTLSSPLVSGNLGFSTDGGGDIGVIGTSRPANVNVSTTVNVNNGTIILNSSGQAQLSAAAAYVSWGTPADNFLRRTAAGALSFGTTNGGTNGQLTAGPIVSSGAITSSSASAGIGYATGAGAAVTQATSRTTGVTINAISGTITTNTASLAAEAAAAFVVTNSSVAIGDVVVVAQRSGAVGAMTDVVVVAVAAGSFTLSVMNNNPAAGVAETGAIIINFCVIKAVSA